VTASTAPSVVLVFVLRIPFRLLEATGFNIAKIEDTPWARLFKVLEIVVILYVAARWGLEATVSS
jgi:fumarate reductase subunit D